MNRLKILRKIEKLTQPELANKVNVATLTIARWEKGESAIKSDKAQELAEIFGVSVAYLLGYTDDPVPPHLVKTIVQSNIKTSVSLMTPFRSEIKRFGEELKDKNFLDPRQQVKTEIDFGLESYSAEFNKVYAHFLDDYKDTLYKEYVRFLNNLHTTKDADLRKLYLDYEQSPEGRAYFEDMKDSMFGRTLNRKITKTLKQPLATTSETATHPD